MPGIVTDGVTDNWPTINNWFTVLSAFGGITPPLPAGPIAISKDLVPPSGVFLAGSYGVTAYSKGGGTGSVLTATASASFTKAMVHFSNASAGLTRLAVNAYGCGTTAVWVSADLCSIEDVGIQGDNGSNALDSDSGATNFNIAGALTKIRSYNQSQQAINSNGSDWVCTGGRTLGAITANAPGAIWTNWHYAQVSGLLLLATVSGDTTFSGCYFDSVNGTGPTALISVTGGYANLFGCRYYMNYAFSGFPMIINNGGVVNLVGGQVATPSQGASGQFSCILSGAGANDVVVGLKMAATCVPFTSPNATMFLSANGGPILAKQNSYTSFMQKEYPIVANATTKQTMNPTPGVNNTYGTAANLALDAGAQGTDPQWVAFQWAGTFSGDTVTIELISTFSDGTTSSAFSAAQTSTQESVEFTSTTFDTLYKDGVYIASVACSSKTSAASTTVTTFCYWRGRNIV